MTNTIWAESTPEEIMKRVRSLLAFATVEAKPSHMHVPGEFFDKPAPLRRLTHTEYGVALMLNAGWEHPLVRDSGLRHTWAASSHDSSVVGCVRERGMSVKQHGWRRTTIWVPA